MALAIVSIWLTVVLMVIVGATLILKTPRFAKTARPIAQKERRIPAPAKPSKKSFAVAILICMGGAIALWYWLED